MAFHCRLTTDLCQVHPHAPALLDSFNFLAVSPTSCSGKISLVSFFFFFFNSLNNADVHYKHTSPFSGVVFPICPHLLLELWVLLLLPTPLRASENTTKVTSRHPGVGACCCTPHCHCHSSTQAACDTNREDALPGLGRGLSVSGVMSVSTRF